MYLCVYMLSQFEIKRLCPVLNNNWCLCTPVSPSMPEMEDIYATGGHYFKVSLFTLYLLACQVRVTIGDSGLCCCVCVTSFER